MRHTQRGNILFLILLAIILFVALTYAVNNGMRGGSKDASDEKYKTLAAQIAQNFSLIENSMTRAMTVDSIPAYGFDVGGVASGGGVNATCTQASCKIYASHGGGVPDLPVPTWASTSSTQSLWYTSFRTVSIVNVGTSNPDLVVIYRYLQPQLCAALNSAFGATDIDLNNWGEGWGSYGSYLGTLTDLPASSAILGDTITAIAGKRAFCFQHSSEGYTFVYVLMAR